jgi:hypothetical protein
VEDRTGTPMEFTGTAWLRDVCSVVRTVRRSIGGVGRTTGVNKDKVISGEQFRPARLTTVEDFGAHEDFEVFMISEDHDGVFGAFTVVMPVTESENNGKHFVVVNVVVAFSWI